jgi:hypothetical protein
LGVLQKLKCSIFWAGVKNFKQKIMNFTIKLTVLVLLYSGTAQAQCWDKIGAGARHALAIKKDSSLWTWGDNYQGQLGQDTLDLTRSLPKQVGTDKKWVDISGGYSASMGLKADGTVWVWGDNSQGYLGVISPLNALKVPTQIGTANDWAKIIKGFGTNQLIKKDGSLWAWGMNTYGTLGDSTVVPSRVPKQVGTAKDWKEVAGGDGYVIALKTNGTLWSWGYNLAGQLGHGRYSLRVTVPTQIGTANNWKAISTGSSHTIALKTDGTLWAWGSNYQGTIGDGTQTARNSPVQVGRASDWAYIGTGSDNSMAIKTDGTLWVWGNNVAGQLGDGTRTIAKAPIQFGNRNNWKLATAGGVGFSHYLLDNNDNLSALGSNVYGQLGNGSSIDSGVATRINCFPVGINPLSENFEITIYPNPATDFISIDMNDFNESACWFTIINSIGQIVGSGKMFNSSETIDISALPTGLFNLIVKSSSRQYTKQFVKMK